MAQSTRAAVKIRLATFPDDKPIVGQLFLAYSESLPISLDFQNFEDELAALPGKYAVEKGGAVWLAYASSPSESAHDAANPQATASRPQNQTIGCIAIRPFHSPTTTPSATLLSNSTSPTTTTCELKRLYLTPESRGLGVSKLLMDVAVSHAKKLGYKEMLLDTLSSMTTARRLYERYGFEEIGSYYESVEDAVFYRLVL
ncbi:acyl-CoA N-acyltransferase [Decorospora gaudefroyi]|uniref:Acyl-CoA N-acyltransferase n=1 Tax=Decorospora gaudefroyi TaxID=184978 RepID=A0A6A5K1I4_9PLEO|nr:acyl-CoA N-acyltransferase [Decorospora gaudefroyi]